VAYAISRTRAVHAITGHRSSPGRPSKATACERYFLVPVTWTEARGIVIILKKSDASLQLVNWPGVQPCDTGTSAPA
jgi:hypothetical protein